MRLWKLGRKADAPKAGLHVRRFLRLFAKVCKAVGKYPLFAKSHELLHIEREMLWFGSATETSSGSPTVAIMMPRWRLP